MSRLGEELRRLRKQAGLRQEDVSDRLDVSQSSVSDWETGITTPSVATLTRLFVEYRHPPEEWAGTLQLAQEPDAPTEAA